MNNEQRVQKTVLDNGLTIVTERNDFVKSAAIGVWVNIGSRYEQIEHSGITHFLEHMLFKGTESRSSFDIVSSIESRGGYLNAFTSNEYTAYYARCLDSEVGRALEILSDMVQHPAFPEKEVQKEKNVVIEEMKMYRDSPDDLVIEEFIAQIFENHPLGRPILGYENTVNAFSREDLLTFVGDNYNPDNMLISVAGNVDHDEIVRDAKLQFNGKKKAEPLIHSDVLTPYRAHQKRFQKEIEQTHYVIGKRGISTADEDRYQLLLLNTMLGGGMSSRLHQNVREKYGYCYSINSLIQSYRDTGVFAVYVGTDQSYLDHVKELVLKEFADLKENKVSDQELADAKTQLKGFMLLGQESMSNRMARLAKSEIYYNRYIPLEEIEEHIDEVTADSLRDFAQDFLDEKQLSETILTPQNKD